MQVRLPNLLCCAVVLTALCLPVAAQNAANPAVLPKDRLNENWWAQRHEQVLRQIKANPNTPLILLGDSITQNYEKANPPDENFKPTWQRFYGVRGAINEGFSGDRTEHVLWRLDHGEVDGLHPRAVLLLIGTNNTGAGQTADQTEAGIDTVIDKIEEKLPRTSILLLGILPSEVSDKKSAADAEINRYLSTKYAIDAKVTYLDIAPAFYKDGKLDTSIFYDARLSPPRKPLHPDTTGQRLMAEAVEPSLIKILQDSARQYLSTLNDVNTAIVPVPRLEMDIYDWYARHRDVLALKQTMSPQVVMIGDSITHFWAGNPVGPRVSGPKSWQQLFGDFPVLNLGYGFDRTQNVLWRLEHGEFEGLRPKTVVLNIGTNNLTGTANARANTPEEIVQGIVAIVDLVHRMSPETRIIVIAVFPRGFDPLSTYRAPIKLINELLPGALAGRPEITFLDIGAKFLEPDGTLPKSLFYDGTHPSEAGYEIWAKALEEAGVGR